jgi:mono/diheme cytochrome c family protein
MIKKKLLSLFRLGDFIILLSGLYLTGIHTAIAQTIPSDGASFAKGKNLFIHNCIHCHGIGNEVLGPSLVNIPDKRPIEWLMSFIRNSQQMIADKDSIASFLYEQYNHNVMPSFHKFSDQDILDILSYINKQSFTAEEEQTSFGREEKALFALEGKQLFNNNCRECHGIGHRGIGPGLASVPKTRTMPWLHSFIKNSQQVIKSGEPHANFLYRKYNNTEMPSFDFLSDDDIQSILIYIRNVSEAPSYVGGVNGRLKLSEDKFVMPDYNSNAIHSTPELLHSYPSRPTLAKISLMIVSVLVVIAKIILGYKIFKKLYNRQKNEI